MHRLQVPATSFRSRRISIWIAVATLVASAIATPAARAATDADTVLLQTFAPALRVTVPSTVCADGNGHEPIAVDAVLAAPQVALVGQDGSRQPAPTADAIGQAGGGSFIDIPGTPGADECALRRWEAALLASGAKRVSYARLVRDPDAPTMLFAQYWFFLVANDWTTTHEGDWEMIQLEFDSTDPAAALQIGPTRLTYSQHAAAQSASWIDVSRTHGTHPLVWMARGSNAAEFGSGVYLRTADGCDVATDAATTRPLAPVMIASDAARAVTEAPWLAFSGRWGSTSSGAAVSPRGPAYHQQWNAPWRWAQRSRDSSVRVPSRGPIAGLAASTLCGAVALSARGIRGLDGLPTGSKAAFGGALLIAILLVILRGWAALRRHDARIGVWATVATATVGLGLIAGILQWVGTLLAVGAFAALTDTIAVLAALIVPALTIMLLGAAAVIAVTRRGGVTASAVATFRHPVRTWRASAPHTTRLALVTMVGFAILAAIVTRALAIAAVIATGWAFWTATIIASLFDAILVGGVLIVAASHRNEAPLLPETP